MKNKKRRRRDWPVWFGVAIALIAVYFGVYALVIQRRPWNHGLEGMDAVRFVDNPGPWPLANRAHYSDNKALGSAIGIFFLPAHLVDRVVRRDYWREGTPY